MTSRIGLFSFVLVVSLAPLASAGINLGDYNLITIGNVSDRSDVQGRVLVGGTLLTNNFTFGGHLGGASVSPPAGIFNAIDSGVTNLNTNGTNFLYGSGKSSINGVTATPSAVATFTNGLASYLNSVSSAYAGLTTNSTINTADMNQIAFNATPTLINGQSVAVFSVDQSFFNGSGTVSQLNGVTAGTTVIVNVTGGTVGNDPLSFGSLNFSAFQNLSDQANILFNFENATQLNNITNLAGAILAPNAALNTGSSLVGSVFVQSITNVGEIDRPKSNGIEVNGFTGFVPSVAVPEPASIVSTLAGLVLVGGTAWRRRRLVAG